MNPLNERVRRAVAVARGLREAVRPLTTGSPDKLGHPRDGLAGTLVRSGYSDGEAAAVHAKAGEHLVAKHGFSNEQALSHLNGPNGAEVGRRLGPHSPEHAVAHVGSVLDAHMKEWDG